MPKVEKLLLTRRGPWVFMKTDPIFQALTPEELYEAARFLAFDPIVSTSPLVWLSKLSTQQQQEWLHENRTRLEQAFCEAGSWSFGETKSYSEVLRSLAASMSLENSASMPIASVEASIVQKTWANASSKMTAEQLAAVRTELEKVAAQHGKSVGAELTGFAALSAAQLSGFGVYILGSTVLGAINGALGLGLSFGAFTGLSSLISVVIGPVGWIGLGLATVVKLGSPNYKKILPVVILAARRRAMMSDVDIEQIRTVEQEVQLAAKRQKPKKSAPSNAPRRMSEQERRTFDLKNPELIRMAKELGVEYHDLLPEEQQYLRDCLEEQNVRAADEAKEATRQLREAKRIEKQNSGTARAAESSLKKNVAKKKAEYRLILSNLEFADPAMEWLCHASEEMKAPFLRELSRLNQGHFNPKCTIKNTFPKITEQEAGKDGRIYYRPGSNGSRTYIALLGTKASQESDIHSLRSS